MKHYNSDYQLLIKHFGHPVNNWGFEIIDRNGKIVKQNMFCGQYNPQSAIKESAIEFLKITDNERG